MPSVGGEGAQIDGRLGVGGEDDEGVPGGEGGESGSRLEGREGAGQPAGVEVLGHTIP